MHRVEPSQLLAIRQQYPGNSSEARQLRMLCALDLGGITRLDASEYLDIPNPYATINQLRDDGSDVVTRWRYQGSEKTHAALYVLEGLSK